MKGASLREIEVEYRRHFRAFVRVAAAIAGGEEAGRDAVHDAFVAAVRGRRAFRREAPLEAWLWRAVVNSARKHAGRPTLQLDAAYEPASNGSADHSDLRAAIALLPERQRHVLFLRYFADLDYDAIAHALDIAPGTVGATLHAARAALRSHLEVERL